MFFKNLIFPDFRSIESVAWPIEIATKNLVWICLARSLLDWCWINQICFSIDWTYFSTDWKSVKEFFKTWVFHVLFTISKVFKKLLSLSLSLSLSLFNRFRFTINFLSFSLQFFSRFLSSSTSKTILPFLFQFNLIFHAF